MSKNQAHPISVRPNKGVAEYVANKLRAEGKFAGAFNDWLESLGDDSPALLKLEIDQALKKKADNESLIDDLVKQNKVIESGIAFKQSRLNSFIHRDANVDEAQKAILKMWKTAFKDTLRGEMEFRNWITGPANLELMTRAGFRNDDQVVLWCKGTVPK